MAHMLLLWMSEMYYMLLNGSLVRLNADCLPPSLKLNQADGEFLLDMILFIPGDAIILFSPAG
jgi:hypothetical protein